MVDDDGSVDDASMNDIDNETAESAEPPQDPRPTQPPAPPPPAAGRRLRRGPGGPFGGVATGVARWLDVDPIVAQAAFVGLTLFGGLGVLLYLSAWFLLPDDTNTDPRAVVITDRPGRVILGIAFMVGALSVLFGSITIVAPEFAIALIVVAGGLYLLNQRGEPLAALTQFPFTTQPASPTQDATPPPPASDVGSAPPPPAPHWATAQLHDEVAPPPPPVAPTVPQPPRPPVTSVTLAIGAIVVGILLAVDQLTTAEIGSTVIFGSLLGVIGLGLIASAFIGRAFALIPLGLLAALGLALSPVTDPLVAGGIGPREITPRTLSDLDTTYELGAGPLELDLRRIDFTEDRTITIQIGAGYAEVRVPRDVSVDVEASSRFGYVELFGEESAGIGSEREASRIAEETPDDGAEPHQVSIVVEVMFGYVEVRHG